MSGDYEFVIVGSGAGGGPLAANLALAGHSVLLVEAGGDETNDNYSVPAFHPSATEDPLYSWEFYVDHYTRDPERDSKYHKPEEYPGAPGIFYPRASTLGGCTGHHAMITVYPAESDWDAIARLVGDDSWSAKSMRRYFERIERAQYRDASVLLKLLQPWRTVIDLLARLKAALLRRVRGKDAEEDTGTRGGGWLSVNQVDPLLLKRDRRLLKIVARSVIIAKKNGLHPMPGLNPNHPLVADLNLDGVNIVPISVHNDDRSASRGARRAGSRERVLDAQEILRRRSAAGKRPAGSTWPPTPSPPRWCSPMTTRLAPSVCAASAARPCTARAITTGRPARRASRWSSGRPRR